jgi:hypothetical protein
MSGNSSDVEIRSKCVCANAASASAPVAQVIITASDSWVRRMRDMMTRETSEPSATRIRVGLLGIGLRQRRVIRY